MFGKGDHKVRIHILFIVVLAIAPVVGYGQAKEPLLLNLGSLKQDASSTTYVSSKYTVPAGKRLVIEQVFIEVVVPSGSRPRGNVRVDTGYTWGSSAQYLPFLFTSQGTLSDDEAVYTASQPMKIYVNNPANGGYTKKISFYITVTSGYASASQVSMSGYLEDAV
ncbi:MAG TPA: hypothetical protein VL572_00345 [Pyrinomonadaceae bacterium]|jgi:hypothetical protein|nr:hypothetical protein [Pyrinomonadaceae bacterium]